MAYSTSGSKVYASIGDLPQYSSIGNGDRIIIWNETREGAATVDFSDFLIDLDHCTFKSTISEVLTLTQDINSFITLTAEEIESLQETVVDISNTINTEIRGRLKALEFIVAVLLGANSYWLTKSGLENLRTKFIQEGIEPLDILSDTAGAAETEEEKENLKWYNGLISTIQNFVAKQVPTVNTDELLLQSKFKYRYSEIIEEVAEPVTSNVYNKKQIIETKGADGKVTSSTEIRYE
jgi:hypothetical protein